MKHERTVRECTFQASDTAPPCVIIIDPDPLSARRFSHAARWTWTDEEALFMASIVLDTLRTDCDASPRRTLNTNVQTGLTHVLAHLSSIINPGGEQVATVARKKRLTPKRKGA